jgi:hypothetical protein
MGRRAISEFQVKQTSYPNAGRYWYIVGRPGGKRIRAWFDTKLVAQAEATRRNLSIQRFGHSMREEAKSLSELTLLSRSAPKFVNFAPESTGRDCDPRLILDEPNFVENFSHRRSRLPMTAMLAKPEEGIGSRSAQDDTPAPKPV